MVINQGDVYWVELSDPEDLETGYRRPHVVLQNNLFNHSKIRTVVVCALTSNLKRAESPGNILLDKKEANLPQQSVINMSQIFTVYKSQLTEYVGTLSRKRVRQMMDAVNLILEPREME
jgi:mRNA interferase MazF